MSLCLPSLPTNLLGLTQQPASQPACLPASSAFFPTRWPRRSTMLKESRLIRLDEGVGWACHAMSRCAAPRLSFVCMCICLLGGWVVGKVYGWLAGWLDD
ncbi:uncharacterized protein BKA78DRAFT_313524 [Phyllosticta capitalensis]|uniref:uncharacterized protein n=1 Tax=Phyllosticta capitalensis TaxID=121624 RepID=UPI00312F54A9